MPVGRTRRSRRNVMRGMTAGAVLLLGLALATARLFVWPPADDPTDADAVVMFVGGQGERLVAAERLMAEGRAPNLVIPNGFAPEWPGGFRACREPRPYDVHCPRPEPDTTRGEARAIAALAKERGWTRVIVVTSSYHVTRARLHLERCFDGQVQTMPARPKLSVSAWAQRIVHEWLGWAQAKSVDRGC